MRASKQLAVFFLLAEGPARLGRAGFKPAPTGWQERKRTVRAYTYIEK